MDIEIYKLYSDDYIIGEVDSSSGQADVVLLKNPRILLMVPAGSGNVSIALKPICFPFTSKRLTDEFALKKSQVMFSLSNEAGEIEKEIIDGYMSEVAGIKIASTIAEATSIANAALGNNV